MRSGRDIVLEAVELIKANNLALLVAVVLPIRIKVHFIVSPWSYQTVNGDVPWLPEINMVSCPPCGPRSFVMP